MQVTGNIGGSTVGYVKGLLVGRTHREFWNNSTNFTKTFEKAQAL